MKVIPLEKPANLEATLAVVDRLRADIESGRIVAFAAVSINEQDDVESWSGAVRSVSRLRIQGAVSHLLHCLHTGDA